MYKDKSILCVITARKGSQGLKNKNLLKLGDKPLVEWSISSAIKSKYIDEIYLSTDSLKIMKIAEKYKLIKRPLRSKSLSTAKSKSIDVVISVIKSLKCQKKNYDYVILLEPTSPFTETKDIDLALEKLINTKNNSLVSIAENITGHPNFNFILKKNQVIKPYNSKKYKFFRRQDLSKVFYLDGSLYISKINHLLSSKNFCNSKTIGFIMPKYKSFEVDDYLDLMVLKTIYKNIKKIKNI